jgi:hypothetical protein
MIENKKFFSSSCYRRFSIKNSVILDWRIRTLVS